MLKYRSPFHNLLVLLVVFLCPGALKGQSLTPYAYDIGSPIVTDYYISVSSGSDDNDGLSPSTAWRSVQHAWNQIPSSVALSPGYRFNLMDGNYGIDELPNYWELKQGSYTHPIIIQPAPGNSSVTFVRDINMAHVSYFYLIGIEITPEGGGDAFHCESCDHLLIRGAVLNGGSITEGAHETLKVNQSQYVYIENSNISQADDNAIDFVGVQYGHLIGNRVHDAADWCAYVKGGSAQIRIESNFFYNCGTGGVTAGQGSGFQFMTSPWIHYEAYDIKIINNVIHDTEGAAIGVNGGYNVLVAHNTAYRIGTRSHLLEVVFGERTCDGEMDGAAESTCAAHNASGGWGPPSVNRVPEYIGNKNIYILNNILSNPSGVAASQHFAIYGPRAASSGTNIPSPQETDQNLVISGNLIWNGSVDTPLGIEDAEQGCQNSNPTCTQAGILASNSINNTEPEFQNPSQQDFRPAAGSIQLTASPAALASFPGGDREASPLAPEGELLNTFLRDFSGAETSPLLVGAYAATDAAISPPQIGDTPTPSDPGTGIQITTLRARATRTDRRVSVKVSARIASSSPLESVSATVAKRSGATFQNSLALRNGRYVGKVRRIKMPRAGRLTVTVTASDGTENAAESRSIRAP